MPDKRTHRGPHPEDARLFSADWVPYLRQAVADMSWLLSRGYADKSSLKLVGDRYELDQRQRVAVMRAACSDEQLRIRTEKAVQPEDLTGQDLTIDGYNLLITVEAALGRAVLFIGRDGCIRDIASIHGTYRKVEETLPAVTIISHILSQLNLSNITWLLDKPVSNSGRLKKIIDDFAAEKSLPWEVRLVSSPDKLMLESEQIIATSDSAVLDGCRLWLNLARIAVETIQLEYNIFLLSLQNP